MGRNDIASVFTLPNACFGRQKEIEHISTIIRKTAWNCGHIIPRRSRLDSSTVDSLLTPVEVADKKRLSLFKRLNSTNNKRTSTLFKRRTETVAISGSAGVGKYHYYYSKGLDQLKARGSRG